MKTIRLMVIVFAMLSISNTIFAYELPKSYFEEKEDTTEELNILWTTDNAKTALNMIAMYANYANRNKEFDKVTIIIWGGSNILIRENEEIQQAISDMLDKGINVRACKACSNEMGTTKLLQSLGVDVGYMGKPLTEIIKNKEYLLTI